MKKILLVLSVFAINNFSYAQTLSSSVKDASNATTKTYSISQSKEVQDQIKEQLVKNEELGTMAIGHLKTDPEAKSSITKLYNKNKGSVNDIMKSVMSDPKLSIKVMDWVNNNPIVLEKLMSFIKM